MRISTCVGFLMESTRKGCLIPGAILVSIGFFYPLENPCSLYYQPSTEQPSDNGGKPILVIEIVILLQFDRCQVNYINTLLYPGSVSVQPIHEHDVLGTLIEDLTSKSALLSCNLI